MRALRGPTPPVLASIALLAAAAIPGCHLIYPFEVSPGDAGTDQQADTRREAAITDGTADGKSSGDLPLCPGDTPPVTQERVACSCPAPTDDCDAIPEAPAGNERDREPALCNELLWEETFTSDPLKGSRWKTLSGSWTHTCGWLQQPSTSPAATSWVQAVAPPLGGATQDAHYLVEARFELGAPGNQQVWQVGIAARVGAALTSKGLPRDYVSCVVRVDALGDDCADCVPAQKIVNPDLRLESYNANGGNPAWPRENPPGSFDPAAGRTYLLQLWYRPLAGQEQLNCRLYDDANTWRRNGVYVMYGTYGAGHTKYMPKTPGTVALRTLGRAASFDYVRVFRLKTDAR